MECLSKISRHRQQRLALAGLLSFKLIDTPEVLMSNLRSRTPLEIFKHHYSDWEVKLNKIAEWLTRDHIRFVIRTEPEYPDVLLDDPSPPIALFIKGNWAKSRVNRAVSIVGTRKPTSYGISKTRQIAGRLADTGLTVISGLAFGVDSLAHQAVIDNAGTTIAVVPMGLKTIYPRSHLNLAQAIIQRGGCLISEFGWVTLSVRRWSFYRRNRIIAALGKALIVTQGDKKSGTLITASQAINLGRPVYALPGRIDNPKSWAPNFLIQQGAAAIISIDELIEDIFTVIGDRRASSIPPDSSSETDSLVRVFKEAGGPLGVEEVADKLGWSISRVIEMISSLEIRGLLAMDSSGKYYLNKD